MNIESIVGSINSLYETWFSLERKQLTLFKVVSYTELSHDPLCLQILSHFDDKTDVGKISESFNDPT